MKHIFIFTLFLLLSSCGGTQSIKENNSNQLRQIAYVEQENPGALIVLTLTDTGKNIGGGILDVKAGMRDNHFPLSTDTFNFLWSQLSRIEISQYQFTPAKSDSMSDPKYYTITKISGNKDVKFRIPISSNNKEVKELISALKEIIRKQS